VGSPGLDLFAPLGDRLWFGTVFGFFRFCFVVAWGSLMIGSSVIFFGPVTVEGLVVSVKKL